MLAAVEQLLARSALVPSDSGGIQEEAASLGVRVLVLSERPSDLAASAL